MVAIRPMIPPCDTFSYTLGGGGGGVNSLDHEKVASRPRAYPPFLHLHFSYPPPPPHSFSPSYIPPFHSPPQLATLKLLLRINLIVSLLLLTIPSYSSSPPTFPLPPHLEHLLQFLYLLFSHLPS